MKKVKALLYSVQIYYFAFFKIGFFTNTRSMRKGSTKMKVQFLVINSN